MAVFVPIKPAPPVIKILFFIIYLAVPRGIEPLFAG